MQRVWEIRPERIINIILAVRPAILKGERMIVNLTRAEIRHIQTLILDNECEGWYSGPKDQYWKRSGRIKVKLSPPQVEYHPDGKK